MRTPMILIAFLIVPLSSDIVSAEEFVAASGTKLMLGGKEFRVIGVNVPHLSQGYMGTWFHWRRIYGTRERMRQAIVEAILDAERHDLAFIRFFASPGYPKGTAELYLKDKDEYWRQMDELFDLCRAHNVRLVPSLGVLFKWNLDCGELQTAVLDSSSRTHAATYGYVREFVTRYKDDSNILMWELQNEAFLRADVNVQDRPARPKGVYPPGFSNYREKYTIEDSFRFDDLVRFYKEMTTFIKTIDQNHLVTSGDSGVREESACRRETFPDFKWRNDTLHEHLSNLLESQTEPLDVFSLHMCELVHGGYIGELRHIKVLLPKDNASRGNTDFTTRKPPEHLNYEMWQGQAATSPKDDCQTLGRRRSSGRRAHGLH